DCTLLRLDLGPGDSTGRQVRGSYRETALGQSNGLGADAARDIENRFGTGSPALGDNGGELPGLALDALVPIRDDQMIKACHLVIEIAHRFLLPYSRPQLLA